MPVITNRAFVTVKGKVRRNNIPTIHPEKKSYEAPELVIIL